MPALTSAVSFLVFFMFGRSFRWSLAGAFAPRKHTSRHENPAPVGRFHFRSGSLASPCAAALNREEHDLFTFPQRNTGFGHAPVPSGFH